MPLQIKVGHRYRTRSGDVVKIVNFSNTTAFDQHYPFAGRTKNEKIEFYAPDGTWHLDYSSDFDLIEELPARCPHCNDSGGVETGEGEYSTCPCVSDVAAP